MKIILGGALGRMGAEMARAVKTSGDEILLGVDAASENGEIASSYGAVTVKGDVLIDFSRPSALPELLDLIARENLPAVLCATGYSADELEKIRKAAERVPILRSANMSLGVNVMLELVDMAARSLPGFDAEIIEKHHNQKADAPSGTAFMLYDALAAARNGESRPTFGREGKPGPRQQPEIGLHAVRGGTVTGEHEVGFYGPGEEILITHRAENRSLFAQGALTAARWLQGKPAGLYSMRDVVREMLGSDENKGNAK